MLELNPFATQDHEINIKHQLYVTKKILVFVQQSLYAVRTLNLHMEPKMGNTYKDIQSRKVHKNLKANLKSQNFSDDDETLSFASLHQAYAKKKRIEHTAVDTVGSRFGNQRKMRSAQDIRARRAERHTLNSNLDSDPPFKPASPAKSRGAKWSG